MKKNNIQNVIGIAGLIWAGKSLYQEFKAKKHFSKKVAFITGGSKGLGLTLAEELINEGCQVAICARDEEDLAKAQKHLEGLGGEVRSYVCDVGNRSEVEWVVNEIIKDFGRIDFVFNNAGIISVGSMESFGEEEYKKSLDIMYWGIVNTTLAVIPEMKKRKNGQIINITSIGGEISVPHLLSYSAAKFAAVGFSKGSAAELRKDNIFVTTIVPGLMRTGSYVNAKFPVDEKEEFKMFSFLSSTPGLTLNPRRAAKKILQATKEKKYYQILGNQNKILVKFTHLFPNLTISLFSYATRLLPYRDISPFEEGKKITEKYDDAELGFIRKFGETAQERHQLS
ncbi:MAG TPA: SDR family oxidoreductase [Bacteriovoracaceae bacterium]|nr:SDR family oxidoreductase [Bacteriovoracaceae bacterium]